MAEEREPTFYAALALSLVSSLAWLAAPVLALYTLYVAATGGAIGDPAFATVAALSTGIVFARLERRYQPKGFRD
ncbi:hypothetical protein [Saliphagus infecundisoli]|uniref:Uncharacterized protein n=1 Tax=Saliphagus infecundisoli TaxID=1849069 RepID=A0ABD5QFT8_9EURY|nr:hypothetical protein [Saliphagus infecundisoli]